MISRPEQGLAGYSACLPTTMKRWCFARAQIPIQSGHDRPTLAGNRNQQMPVGCMLRTAGYECGTQIVRRLRTSEKISFGSDHPSFGTMAGGLPVVLANEPATHVTQASSGSRRVALKSSSSLSETCTIGKPCRFRLSSCSPKRWRPEVSFGHPRVEGWTFQGTPGRVFSNRVLEWDGHSCSRYDV